jgi:periplasmic protein TonB
MAALADEQTTPTSVGRRLAVLAAVLAGLLLLGALAWWLKQQLSAPEAPRRQVARISILPDTPPPPPPPPPPKEQPRPTPRADARPPPPTQAPTPPAPAPQDAPIKMEGAAGNGDSPFAAGNVSNDYQGGRPTVGGAAASAPTVVDRAQARLYASSARTLLRDAIEQHLRSDATELTAEFTVWLAADGAIRRVELQPGSDPRQDSALQAALDTTQRQLRLPRPPTALQPMRFRLTVRPQG